MALVRLTKGGGGGGELHGAEIKATIDETSFANQSVYLYKGSEASPTDTKTFPSTATSGVYSVTFTVQEVGTYRIYSKDGSDNEASESKTISSDDIVNKTSYTVELTTGFNYKKWINYGSTDDYPLDVDDYSSLAEVLADEKAVRQLMTVHDSADYFTTALIDDTDLKTTILASDNALKWIGLRDYTYDKLPSTFVTSWLSGSKWEYALKDHVPVMTANDAPYGSVIEVNSHSNYTNKGFQVFDGNNSTIWADANGNNNDCIGYNFVNPICVKRFYVSNQRIANSFVLEASNDNFTTKTELWSISGNTSLTVFDINITNAEYFMSYRFRIITGDGSGVMYPYTIQFYGRTLNVSVPTINSDGSMPYGEHFGDSTRSSNPLKNAFDKNTNTTCWRIDSATEFVCGYKFPKPIKALAFRFGQNAGGFGMTYTVEAKNNQDTQWVPLYTKSFSAVSEFDYIDILNNDNLYSEYRVRQNVTSGWNTAWALGVAVFDIFGLDYSEREFEENSKVEYVYDHGVKIVEIEKTEIGSSTVTERDGSILINNADTSSTANIKAFTNDSLDTTNYKLVRCVLGGELSNLTNGLMLTLDNNSGDYNRKFETTTTPYHNYQDIENVNGSHTLAINAGSTAQTGKIELYEWWIERK